MSQLDPVQLAALKFAEGKPGVGWFMEQGLGKTLTALTEFERLYHDNRIDRAIVICPNTFKQGWADEITKHGFNFHVHVFRSAKREEATEFCRRIYDDKPSLMIVNYEAARIKTVIAGLIKWAGRGRTYLVIDESIQIKSPPTKSQQTKAVHALAAWSPYTNEPFNVRFVRILTGRPQTQGPHDLWGQLRAIGLVQSQNFYAFRGRYCVMGGFKAKQVLAAQHQDQLAEIMAPVVFQAKKKDWLPALPTKRMTIRDYEMSGEQKRQYTSMEEEFLLEIESGTVTVDVAIAKYAKLAQIQTGFIYDEAGVARELVDPSENPRLNLLLNILEDEVQGKAVVVYRHRAILPVLIETLKNYNPAWIKGGMKPDEVEEQKRIFNDNPDCRIILAQCDAAKYGHTLLAGPAEEDRCRTMIFFENSYSADTRDQIEDRIHRRGQTGEYVLYVDLSGSDLDRRIVKALQRKDSLYRSVFKHLKEAVPA
jgi:SNF2 family DNA or RNA helicase